MFIKCIRTLCVQRIHLSYKKPNVYEKKKIMTKEVFVVCELAFPCSELSVQLNLDPEHNTKSTLRKSSFFHRSF